MGVHPPRLRLFVELSREPLVELFADGTCADVLAHGGFGLAMGILDLSPERAHIVRALERRGIPVTAWLLLAEADGYWLNADNAKQAVARYDAVRAWAQAERLALGCIGLDVEFPRADADALMHSPVRAFVRLLRRRRSRADVAGAEEHYARLVDRIHTDGREVESYQLPLLLDERAMNATLLRRTLGLVDVAVDREVYMLYSTYLGSAGSRGYMPEAPAIAVGSTGGGVDGDVPKTAARHLRWDALETDLLAAAAHCRDLYVFSLEGCIRQGMLERLVSIDWRRPAPPVGAAAARRAARARRRLHTMLRAERLLDWIHRPRRTPPPREGCQPLASSRT
jgi:hypothetical protein